MRKYDPLSAFLARKQASRVMLAFSEIERILGDRLPESAGAYRPWWANEQRGRHVQAHAWQDAGWRVASVDIAGERVEFERMG